MTELTFLIELLLNHELKKETKDAIAARIKEVELLLISNPKPVINQNRVMDTLVHSSIPSTVHQPQLPPVPPEAIAQTKATAAALQARSDAMTAAINGNSKSIYKVRPK